MHLLAIAQPRVARVRVAIDLERSCDVVPEVAPVDDEVPTSAARSLQLDRELIEVPAVVLEVPAALVVGVREVVQQHDIRRTGCRYLHTIAPL